MDPFEKMLNKAEAERDLHAERAWQARNALRLLDEAVSEGQSAAVILPAVLDLLGIKDGVDESGQRPQIVPGYVWCDAHCGVHPDEPDYYQEGMRKGCRREAWTDLWAFGLDFQ